MAGAVSAVTSASGGETPAQTPHRVVNPPNLSPPVGFAHGVVAAPGHAVYLGGQTAARPDGTIAGDSIAEQFDGAAANVAAALVACGAGAHHLVQLTVYTTDVPAYRAAQRDIGAAYRRHFGRHFPAVALLGVSELFDPAALVELVGVAMIPH